MCTRCGDHRPCLLACWRWARRSRERWRTARARLPWRRQAWNLRQVGDTRDVVVQVPWRRAAPCAGWLAEDQHSTTACKHWPRPARACLGSGKSSAPLLRIEGVVAQDASAMSETFGRLRELRHGRNGIWPFVCAIDAPAVAVAARQQLNVLLGNPPWIAYRALSAEMKRAFAQPVGR